MDTARPGITSITVTVNTTPDPRAMARLARAMMDRTSETPGLPGLGVSAPAHRATGMEHDAA